MPEKITTTKIEVCNGVAKQKLSSLTEE